VLKERGLFLGNGTLGKISRIDGFKKLRKDSATVWISKKRFLFCEEAQVHRASGETEEVLLVPRSG
jgi:hypothetical protein